MYKEGKGVEQDYEKAFNLYRLAADNNSPSAQYNLGLMFEEGKGVKQDYLEALKWYQLSINHDYPEFEGFVHLGLLYEYGFGVKQDFVKAAELYQIAVIKGNKKKNIEEAKSRLAALQSKKKTSNVIPLKAKIQNNDPLNIRD